MGRMPPPTQSQPQILVLSVPHSGTRTLVKHLGAKSHQHFGYSERAKRLPYGRRGDLVNIPVRNPISVAESWARRGKPIKTLIGTYNTMFLYLGKQKDAVLHKVEDIPRLAGTNDRDRQEGNLACVHEYKKHIIGEVIEPNIQFFESFYNKKELQ